MILSMAIMVGFWIAFEVSGEQHLGLAKGILVGLYMVAFTFSSVMNAFGATVRPKYQLFLLILSAHTLTVRVRNYAHRDSRCWRGKRIFCVQRSCNSCDSNHTNSHQQNQLEVFPDLFDHGLYFHCDCLLLLS